MAEIRDITDYMAKDALSRRRFLQAAGLVTASLAAGPLLEACGGSGSPSGTTGTGTYVPPKAKAGAKVQLLQWNSFVKAADDEFKRQGYFVRDPDSTPERPVFDRTIGLRDTFAKEVGAKG